MAKNNAWSNARIYDACLQLSIEDLKAERSNFFPSILETLNHILEVDQYYMDGLKEAGKGIEVFKTPHLSECTDLQNAQTASDLELIEFCLRLTESDLERTVTFDRGRRGQHPEEIGLTLLHLFQHQTHHRGQVHSMLSSTSVPPPQLDEFFVEFERHAEAEKFIDDRL